MNRKGWLAGVIIVITGCAMGAAGERDVLLTEIGYPTSPTVRGSSTKQAEFYSRVIQELARGEGRFVAANFMSLADLHPSHASALSDHSGLPLTKFRAVLRTMG